MGRGRSLGATVDPDDPKSIVAWTAQAAGAFDEILRSIDKIEEKFTDLTSWRTATDIRLATGTERFENFNRRIDDCEETVDQLPKIIESAVIKAVQTANGISPNGRVSFKWVLEKVALPLLMSGAGAAIALIATRGIGG
jgi:hypothetical protein